MDKNKQILHDLKSLLESTYPGKIENIILFGSRITGNAHEYSDYDILVIVTHDFNWKFETEIIDLCFDIDLKHDIVTDIKVISKSELQLPRGKQPYIQNALTHGLYA